MSTVIRRSPKYEVNPKIITLQKQDLTIKHLNKMDDIILSLLLMIVVRDHFQESLKFQKFKQ